VLINKYIQLTYIQAFFVLLWLSSIFAEDFISLQLVSYRFVLIFCDNKILILVLFIVKQEDATCIACDLVQHLTTELITMYILSFMTVI
jgi:hypothetical protein